MSKIEFTRNLFRAAGVTTAIVSALGVSAASAHTFTGDNSVTGPSSINRNIHRVTTTNRYDEINRAIVDNYANLLARTGGNYLRNNTTGGDVESGGVSLTGGFTNDVNGGSGEAGVLVESTDVDVDFENEYTGPNSRNDNRVDVRETNRTTVRNEATLRNNVRLDARTGNNYASNNTSVGSIRSGDVEANINLDNYANTGASTASYVGTGSSSVDVSGSNYLTGPNSDNSTRVDVRRDTRTNITNTADVRNNVSVNADTGNNRATNNTTAGDIISGDVSLDFTSTNVLN